MTQHTPNTPTNSNADELRQLFNDWYENKVSEIDEDPYAEPKDLLDATFKDIAGFIQSNYLPKAKVVEAIGEDQDPDTSGRGFKTGYVTRENKLRHEIKRKLGLESKDNG